MMFKMVCIVLTLQNYNRANAVRHVKKRKSGFFSKKMAIPPISMLEI